MSKEIQKTWEIRVKPGHRLFENIEQPDNYGKYGVTIHLDAISNLQEDDDEPIKELMHGIQINTERNSFTARSYARPELILEGYTDEEWFQKRKFASARQQSLNSLLGELDLSIVMSRGNSRHGAYLRLQYIVVHAAES